MKTYYNKLGFTLAEVLITLLIVGVVASLVIPAIIQDAQDAELKTAWKKAYANIDQATKYVMQDNGGTLKSLCTSTNDMRNKYSAYLNYTKNCSSGSSDGNCWHKSGEFYFINGTPITWWGDSAGTILSNGAMIRYQGCIANCDSAQGNVYRCAWMDIDVNGFKGPNRLGKDILSLHILENTIKPFGTQGDGLENSCVISGVGQGCSAKYLYQ
jgi:prepilin-type N-terminal cleavage/methylation domain-containing protein